MKSSKRMSKAKEQHEKWLRKRGVHPSQLKKMKSSGTILHSFLETFQSGFSNVPSTSNDIPANGTKPVDTSKAVFARENYIIAPLSNKQAYGVINKDELIYMGKKV